MIQRMSRYSQDILRSLRTGVMRPRQILFFVFAFCIFIVSIVYFALGIGKPYMGAVLSFKDQTWEVSSIDPNGLASHVGIKVGDKPVEVNDQSAQIFLGKYRDVGTVIGALIQNLAVVDSNDQLKSASLEEGSESRSSIIEQISLFFICIIFWATGFYVYFKRPNNVAAMLLCITSLTFGLAISANTAGERAIPAALELAVVAAIISPWLLLHFFLILPEERAWLNKNSLLYFIYLPPAIILILFPIIGYADGQTLPGFFNIRLFEYALGFIAVVGVVIMNFLRSVSPRTRQQMKIILISCLSALIPFLFLNVLPWAIQGQTVISPGFSLLFIVFIPLGMGYAVVTQKLMDIDIVIRRGMVYSLITIVMAALISIAIFLVAFSNESVSTLIQILVALILGALAAVLFGPIKKGAEILVDRLFYKDRYDYRQVIQSLSNALSSINNLTEVSRLIVGTTVNTLNLSGGCIFIKTQSDSFKVAASQGIFIGAVKQEHLQRLVSNTNNLIEFPNLATTIDPDIAFIIRLATGGKEIGFLLLSYKLSRQHFSSDDLYLIQGISSLSSIALYSNMLIQDVSIRDTFISIASHELRTPLTAITGYTELLLRRNPSEATRKKWLKNILDNGRNIITMANDLLNVTRIQSGKITLKLQSVNISKILNERLNLARENSSIHQFSIHIEPDLPDVVVDWDKFGQIITNLLNNAIKYSPKGGRITLSANYNSLNFCVVTSVADEGIGISPEDTKSLFTTFHRIQRQETQSIRGSGLGLFIAKEWTEAMGGKIWVESELNRGSTFFVSVPVQITNPYILKNQK